MQSQLQNVGVYGGRLSPWADAIVEQAFSWFYFTAQGALEVYFIPKTNSYISSPLINL